MAWRPSAATATIVILFNSCVACAFADRTASDLITAMRFNDRVLQQCVLEGDVVEKIFPTPPPRPSTFQVIVAGGQDITNLTGSERLAELAIRYGTSSGVSLDDVPAEYLPLVQLIRDGKIILELVKGDRPEPVTHRTYAFVLALNSGDVAIHMHGGSRHKDALALAATTQGNKISMLEYFAGTWERVDRVSDFSVNALHEKALWYCFSLGVGFGDRVQSATVQSKRNNLYVVDAEISIWPGKLHDARLLIDNSGVVREADIKCETKRVRCVSGAGTITTGEGTKLASSGRVEVQSPMGRELVNLAVDLNDIPAPVTAGEFAKLFDLSIPED